MKTTVLSLPGQFLLGGCVSGSLFPNTYPTSLKYDCNQTGAIQTISGDSVGEIGISLPPCNDHIINTLYPVLSILPGFSGSSREWFKAGLTLVMDELLLKGATQSWIIVTTDDTNDDLDPNFISTIQIPCIECHYRTDSSRSRSAIAGGSLGGATTFLLAVQYPDLFSSMGIFGNGLISGQNPQIDAWIQIIPAKLRPCVFLNSWEQGPYMLRQAKALIPLMDKNKIHHPEIYSQGGHSINFWLIYFTAFFYWLNKNWK